MGDPPPDPETAPLEVVVGSSQQPDQPCLLNREQVAAGEHEVLLIGETGEAASVVVRNAAGQVLYEADVAAEPQGGDPPPAVVDEGEGSTAVRLTEGEYEVQCLSGGELVAAAPLRVVPARR